MVSIVYSCPLSKSKKERLFHSGLGLTPALLEVLDSLRRYLLNGCLAGYDLLHGSKDVRPVLKFGEGIVFADAVGYEI